MLRAERVLRDRGLLKWLLICNRVHERSQALGYTTRDATTDQMIGTHRLGEKPREDEARGRVDVHVQGYTEH